MGPLTTFCKTLMSARHRWWIRPVLVFLALNLGWELIQLPFYTIWNTGTAGEIIYAVLHCTMGDVMIGVATWAISRLAIGRFRQRPRSDWPLLACFILLALAYTVFSEWRNVNVTRSWAYSDYMPLLPPLGTGLTPILQWIIVPLLTWFTAGGGVRSRLAGRQTGTEGHPP